MRAAVLAVSAVLAPVARSDDSPPAPRNVVLIVLDDVGVDLIGAYETHFRAQGHPAGSPASTPGIDQLLAARGVMFTNAYTSPMCTPSRAQMLTGRCAFRTGVGRVLPHDNEGREFDHPGLSLGETLLPQLLHTAPERYTCAAVGKWHLASATQLAQHPLHPLGDPAGRWFDIFAGSLFNLQDPTSGPGAPTGYWHWVKTYATPIERDVDPCADGELPCDVVQSAPPWSSYATVDTTDDALALLGTLREPWFLYVSYNAAHAPVHDVPRDLPRAICEGYAPPKTPCDAGSPPTTAGRVRCMLAEADAQIARLVCALDSRDTCVILAGDNGTASEALLPPLPPERGKDTLYQGGIHVPLIVCSPDVAPELRGTTCDALVGSTDLFATVAEIAGVASTAEDSISLVPYLKGRKESQRATLYVEEFTPNFTPDPKTGAPPDGYVAERHGQALIGARFKLLRWTRRDRANATRVREELYDLLQGRPPAEGDDPPRARPDPYEQHDLLRGDLAPGSDAAKALATMRAELDTRYRSLVR